MKAQDHFSCIIKSRADYGLATHGAKASANIALMHVSQPQNQNGLGRYIFVRAAFSGGFIKRKGLTSYFSSQMQVLM